MEPTENLFGFEQVETFLKIDSIQIFEEIRKGIEEHLSEQNEDTDSTDSVFNILSKLSDKIQEESKVAMTKHFIRALTRIFALLLNTKGNKVEKINKILKIPIKIVIKIWQGQN